jgi:ParB family chromosome partitioning protein
VKDKPVRKLSPLDELFGADHLQENQDSSGSPTMLKIAQLVPFSDHPFKLYEGSRLEDLVESIRENGVMVPVIVRPKEGDAYEILAGHNRVNAAKIAGLDAVPAVVREGLSEAEARIIVTDTNFMQRSVSDMLPSELAKSLKMQLDACKEAKQKQGFLAAIQEVSLPCCGLSSDGSAPMEQWQWSVEKVAHNNRMSRANIQRYIRLNNLIEDLLDMVDHGKIALRPAVSLSYLKKDEQRRVLDCMEENGFKSDIAKADKLRFYSEAGSLTSDRIYVVLSGVKKKLGRPASVKVRPKIISRFFAEGQSPNEINEMIEKALEQYLPERERS